MNPKLKVWMDEVVKPLPEAHIGVLTHTFHYGGGAFEGIRFYETEQGVAIFRLQEHLKRLFYSAKCIGMKIPYNAQQLSEAIKKIITVNKLKSGYIRPIAYYGDEHLGLHPKGCKVHIAIAAWPWGTYLGTKPVKVKISSFIRIHPKSTYTEAKLCGNYVNSILASMEAIKDHCDEAVLLDYKGNVAEGPGENIFIVKKGILLTPKRGNILKGITRDSILKIAKKYGIPAKEKIISKRALLNADEAFYSGTAAQISAISTIDGKKIGTGKIGPVTKSLQKILTRAVHGEMKGYRKWLTLVK